MLGDWVMLPCIIAPAVGRRLLLLIIVFGEDWFVGRHQYVFGSRAAILIRSRHPGDYRMPS